MEQAVEEAEQQGVDKWGKAATPWLLKRVGELTAGKSLASSECPQILYQSFSNAASAKTLRLSRTRLELVCGPSDIQYTSENNLIIFPGGQIAVEYSRLADPSNQVRPPVV